MPNLSDADRLFVRRVRELIVQVDKGGVDTAANVSADIRELLADRGLESGCHLGRMDLDGSIDQVEWYAGQFLDIVDNGAWFAMNSFCNCMDRFAPAEWT